MRHVLISSAFLLFLSLAVFARDIIVIVEDEELEMPLEGAVVSLRGGQGQQFVCDEEGRVVVNVTDERQTVLQITYPGYDTQRLVISPAGSGTEAIEQFTVSMRLGGVMMGRELVVEADRPESSETKSGRSVAISDRELARTAEIGIIEDVMSSVKLLPGVGYTGMFGAMPSIRGGDPGDLMASFDGFYLELPYHWGGAVSIFDPKMVSSARLSHGVFSSRYGHTVSGLLEISSKSPSNTDLELETAIGSSAASLNLSLPLSGKGGLLFMGKVTYWDTLVWAAQQLSKVSDNENLAMVNAISTSPYIRSFAVSGNYRFSPDTEGRINAFFGSDGVGADFETEYDDDGIKGRMDIAADYTNYQTFFISGINTSPTAKLALRFVGGVGFMGTITDDTIDNQITVTYNQSFWDHLNSFFPELPEALKPEGAFRNGAINYTAPDVNATVEMERRVFTAQTRVDVDWDWGKGFITAFGVQELYSLWMQKGDIGLDFVEVRVDELKQKDIDNIDSKNPGMKTLIEYLRKIPNITIVTPLNYRLNEHNHGFITSGYGLLEYISPNQRIGAEIGLRVDHLYFLGNDFSAQTLPAWNPRLNIDLGLLENRGIVDSLDLTVGTGLFSSMDKLFSFMNKDFLGDNNEIKFNRSWTSVIGIKIDIFQSYSFNIEGYYKRVFDRAYITADITSGDDGRILPAFKFDGVGNVWGFDLQLQKLESRYWDGWISYTFTWAKYMDPSGGGAGLSMGSADGQSEFWYWPSFHRFHNANIVLNIKPLRWFNIAVRFGFASGQPRDKVSDTIEPYPALTIDENGNTVIMQKYRRDSWYDENERSAWSLPLDLKLSFYIFDRKGRVGTEIYVAGENLLSLVYSPAGNVRFNEYTGKEDTAGTGTSGFDLPIPMVSFGFKWRY